MRGRLGMTRRLMLLIDRARHAVSLLRDGADPA